MINTYDALSGALEIIPESQQNENNTGVQETSPQTVTANKLKYRPPPIFINSASINETIDKLIGGNINKNMFTIFASNDK